MNKVAVPAVKKGLDIPISGVPDQRVVDGPAIRKVALLGDDYIGMKPTMMVSVGDRVRLGQPVFEDKKNPGVLFTAPASGTVAAINRGAKRRFESVIIETEGDEAESFSSYADANLIGLDRDKVVENLLKSGLWSSFRTRPYSRSPQPDSSPSSIFVTAMDTNPLAADPAVVLLQPEYERFFVHGLQTLTNLTDGPVYLCKAPQAEVPGSQVAGVTSAEFGGPHPAGLPGTHIHFLSPVNENRTVWHIGYQDVVAIGHLFLNGTLMNDRIVSIAGPASRTPRIIRSQLGSSLADLMQEDDVDQQTRVVSGSVLSGRLGVAPNDFLGRYHQQVCLLPDEGKREFLGWAMPGFQKFSVSKAFASGFLQRGGRLPFSTSTQGSKRAVVPIGLFEKVMPLDLVATPLLKALLVHDTETAQMLGCLELDEEDLSLCTFVCPGKNEYGPLLRQCLTHIEQEG